MKPTPEMIDELQSIMNFFGANVSREICEDALYTVLALQKQTMVNAISEALDLPHSQQSPDKKIAGVIRQLHALHRAFNMKGTNSITMLRAINTLSTIEARNKSQC